MNEMDSFEYKLGKLNEILTGLSYVNNKTNHGYTFEIVKIDASKGLETATEDYLKGIYSEGTASFSNVSDWRREINDALENWLFSYLPSKTEKNGDRVIGGCGSPYSHLKDVDKSFSMTFKSFRDDFVGKISDQISINS